MKKIINNKYYLILIACVAYFIGCSDLNEINQKYIDMGERIYVGKPDSLIVHGGYYRVQIIGTMQYAKTAEKCVISWKNGTVTDSVVVLPSNWQQTDTMKIIIDIPSEGSKRFYVKTYDKDGNTSITDQCTGYTYGDQYIMTSTAKNISKMTPESQGLVCSWNVSSEAVFVEVKYDSDEGVKSMMLPGNVSETIFTDWKLGGTVQCRTALIPESGALDTLYSGWVTQSFPESSVEYLMTKSKIIPLKLPFDANPGYSGKIEGVFDGVISDGGNQFHSDGNPDVPQHLTFDLGFVANLTRFEMWARSDTYHNWNPKIIQMWGTDVLEGANKIALASNNAGWENEARAKGWFLLTEHTCTDPINNKIEIKNQKKVRYIIIRTTEVYGDPKKGSGAHVIIKEITLYSDFVSRIK